jgi:hypothetical protein
VIAWSLVQCFRTSLRARLCDMLIPACDRVGDHCRPRSDDEFGYAWTDRDFVMGCRTDRLDLVVIGSSRAH